MGKRYSNSAHTWHGNKFYEKSTYQKLIATWDSMGMEQDQVTASPKESDSSYIEEAVSYLHPQAVNPTNGE